MKLLNNDTIIRWDYWALCEYIQYSKIDVNEKLLLNEDSFTNMITLIYEIKESEIDTDITELIKYKYDENKYILSLKDLRRLIDKYTDYNELINKMCKLYISKFGSELIHDCIVSGQLLRQSEMVCNIPKPGYRDDFYKRVFTFYEDNKRNTNSPRANILMQLPKFAINIMEEILNRKFSNIIPFIDKNKSLVFYSDTAKSEISGDESKLFNNAVLLYNKTHDTKYLPECANYIVFMNLSAEELISCIPKLIEINGVNKTIMYAYFDFYKMYGVKSKECHNELRRMANDVFKNYYIHTS